MKYLIDSDWIIDHFNGVEAVTKKLEKFAASGLCTSMVSLICDFDLVIASICLRHNLTLLTNNKNHFERIDSLKMVSLVK